MIMKQPSIYSTGVNFGLIGALAYCILLFLRYNFFAESPVMFGLFAGVSYIIILVIYFLAGRARKKELGGYATFKEIFQTIFLTIVITELVYTIFNFVYLKYIDPDFFNNFKNATLQFLEKSGLNDTQIDQQMEQFDKMDEQFKPIKLLQGLGIWIVVDSIIAMIFSAIMKKN